MAEAKLHYICSKLQYKYNDILQTLREKGKLSTREYIDFVDDMESSFDELTSGLPRLTRNHLKDETNKLLEHVSTIVYDTVHDPKLVQDQLEYYYFFDSSGNAKLIDVKNPRKVIHQFIDEPMPKRVRLPQPHIIKEPSQPIQKKITKKHVKPVTHIKASKSLVKDVKKLFTKFIRIQKTIYNGIDKVDGLKTVKGRINRVEKLLSKLSELENIRNKISSIGNTSPESSKIEEEVSDANEYLYNTLNDKYMELDHELKLRKKYKQ